MADMAFERVHAWFVQAVERSLDDVADVAQRDLLRKVLWSLADPVDPAVAPPPALPGAFRQPGVSGRSLSIAAIVVGEALVAIDPLKTAIAAIAGGQLGEAREAIRSLIEQIRRAAGGARVHPSAFGLGKLLLTLSRDVLAALPGDASVPRARQLARLVDADPARLMRTSSTLGVQTLLLGAVLDKAFADDPATQLKDWADFVAGSAFGVAAAQMPRFTLVESPPQPGSTGQLEITGFDPARGVRFLMGVDLQRQMTEGEHQLTLDLKARGGLQVRWDAGQPPVSEDPARPLGMALGLTLKAASGDAGVFGLQVPADHPVVRFQLDELGAGLRLERPPGQAQLAPSVTLKFKGGKLILDIDQIDPTLLGAVLGHRIEVAFDIEALADGAGGLRLKDGNGLRVNLPIDRLPAGPFDLQLITLALEPKDDFARLEAELSISCALQLGPFSASVERIGARLQIVTADGSTTLALKPPTGMGLSLAGGPIQGGGFLSLDFEAGEYKGALELKIAGIGVKALGLLNTRRPGGQWSLLLLIFGNFPPIQLSWGFVLTGVGGLIGVQHTTDTGAMARELGNGGLDAVLFPKDVAGNAPQIFQTLSTLFPFKPGGFVLGPMLEVGWGTPMLVSLRMGVLIEASQIAILGQLVIQIPPLVDKQLAIVLLQLDFVGSIVFDPFKIAFDGKLRDSRVALISITGQFAFRAVFGDKPTFLISAGGFHPRFADIPPDVPMPFDRIGAGFSIGIIGISIKGYFAITAATVQGGFEVKVWGDVGVASFDAGLGFDAICYLQPRFCFDVEFRAWAHAEVFGIGLGVSLRGLLQGPGRWRIRGEASVDLGFFGSVDVDFDEAWGEDTDTPLVTENAFALLVGEAGKRDNWSVQLPSGDESCITVARREGESDALAHPMASLTFTQRRVPLNRTLDKVNEARVAGSRQLAVSGVTFDGLPVPAARSRQREQFAASQFFKVSDDDKLTKPSFEAMDAGEKFHFDEFEFGPVQSAPVDWETRDLSPQPGGLGHLGLLADMLQSHHLSVLHPGATDWMVTTGAVARSGLRGLDRMLPADRAPLSVADAVPMVVTARADQGARVAAVQAGTWAATQALQGRAGSGVQARQWQVVELHELVGTL